MDHPGAAARADEGGGGERVPAVEERRLRCAVIGAGPSGLAVAKALLDQARSPGHDGLPLDVVVFEQSDQVGGNWVYREADDPYFHTSACYASLCTNTPKNGTAFSDMPMPASYPTTPHHAEIKSYLQDYAEHNKIIPHIRFRTRVDQARPLVDMSSLGPITSPSGLEPQPTTSTSILSSIFSALGIGTSTSARSLREADTDPMPTILDYGRPLATASSFLHPDDPRTPQWEITFSCGEDHHTETFDAVAVCNGHHWSPTPLPFDVRECTAQILHSHEYREPTFCTNKRVAVIGLGASGTDITEEVLRVCSKFISCCQRWEEYTARVQSLDTLKQFFPFLNDTRCLPKSVPTRASGSFLYFADGSREEVDIIISCTGYQIKFPFLDESLISARLISSAHPTSQYLPLYKFMFLPHLLSIAFIAIMSVNGSLHPIAEAQGQLFAKFVVGKLPLPSEQTMVDDVMRWFALVHKARRTYRVMEVDPASYKRALLLLDPSAEHAHHVQLH